LSIWHKVKTQIQPLVLRGDLIRVVESQEQIATSQLVDNLEEQIQLEELLEQSKPRYPKHVTGRVDELTATLHYLLSTPFRYPPLIHGARFCSRFEASLFYASKELTTAFSETAFYRFYFWRGMKTPPPSKKYITEHTVFSAGYYSTRGLQLQNPPFSEFKSKLTHPSQYQATQALGNNMRVNEIDVFEYVSARDKNGGINIALFSPKVFVNKKPKEQQQWLCETTAEQVSFSSKEGKLLRYSINDFLIEGEFPLPAA